jgi:alcohol dehydrogenase
MAPFSIARLPRILFGAGGARQLPEIIARFGRRALLVTGAKSFLNSPHWPQLIDALHKQRIVWEHVTVSGEPAPRWVDEAAQTFRAAHIHAVVGIGGGSALDGAKAVAGLLQSARSVMDYLEGVGAQLPYDGPATPFIALPTTAGTGSEATKNAVLSKPGKDGFKKSFRDEQLVAQYAIVDPDLLAGCPPELIAANGMDALTQLIESYVSLNASPVTDALALSGIEAARDGLLDWYETGSVAGRERMAYAALLSGITLAQAGLGSVHGLASPLGAFFPIPHGVVCGTLVSAATEVNIRALQQRLPQSPALAKYALLGRVLCGNPNMSDHAARAAPVQILHAWTERLKLPRLGAYGARAHDFPHIIAHCRGSSMKTNPVVLSDEEVEEILAARL